MTKKKSSSKTKPEIELVHVLYKAVMSAGFLASDHTEHEGCARFKRITQLMDEAMRYANSQHTELVYQAITLNGKGGGSHGK